MLAALATAWPQEEPLRFRVDSNLVILHVTARDRSGQTIAGLKQEDFMVSEDGQPQAIRLFEFQQLSSAPLPPLPAGTQALPDRATPAQTGARHPDRRLIVLFFDLSGLDAPAQIRARNAAADFLSRELTASDLVSVMSFSGRLRTALEFTDNRRKLLDAILKLGVGQADAETGSDAGAEEGAESLSPDEAAFNIFKTDFRLSALEQAAAKLARLPERKALVYFSTGVGKSGSENHAQLLATINASVRANVSLYPVDVRGLQAGAPAGDASRAAPKGTSVFTGRAQTQQRDKVYAQQETLHSLAIETGGKALLDSNDLAAGIRQAQKDVSSYYLIGYYSTNPAQDGRFRKLRVEIVPSSRARLEYRPGYYATKLFRQYSPAEREQQLQEAMDLGNPVTALPLAAEIHYFRLAKDRYFVPVALKVPGSRIALVRKTTGGAAELDFAGQVRDAGGKPVASVRDTLRVAFRETEAGQLTRGALQYDTGFTLPPGTYQFKFLARENQTGKMGTFETSFRVPDLGADPAVRLSSLVLSARREPLSAAAGSAGDRKALADLNPLVREGKKLVPNVAHAFQTGQKLLVFLEVYDVGSEPGVTATLSLIRGDARVYESRPVRVEHLTPKRRQTASVEFEVPLSALAPGAYICQVHVVDENAHNFAFARAPLAVLKGQ